MRRGWHVPLVLLSTTAVAKAQLGAYSMLSKAVNMQQGIDALRAANVKDPLQPTGFPPLPDKYGQLPPGLPEEQQFRLVRAGEGGRSGNDVKIRDGAEFWYRGYHVISDEVDGNLQTSIFTLRGNVHITGKDSVVVGDRVSVNFDNNTFLSQNAESQLDPVIVQGIIKDDLYVNAKESYGSERQIWAHNADVTTCNLKEPHFHFDSKDMEIRPGKRVILRKTKLKLFGRTVLSIDYLNLPLDSQERYTPEFGQSEEEGYFVKNRYGIPLRGDNVFDSRIDYMTKLGTGLGGDYRYFNRNMSGLARIYKITGKSNTFTLSNDHRQEFKWGSLSLQNDYQNNNYLTAPGSTILNTRAQMSFRQSGGNSTRLNLTRAGSKSGGFETLNETIAVSDQRNFGRATRTSLDVNWLQSSTNFQGQPSNDREQIDVRMRGSHELKMATANLEYVRSIPVGETQGIFGGSDRTPFVSLTSDARKLFGSTSRIAERLPFNTELSFGEFNAATGDQQNKISRYNFDMRMNRPDRSDKRLRVDLAGQFRQGMYSDDTAQYTQGASATASYRLGRDTSANFRYNYLRQHGFSPLYIDRAGRTNLFTTDLSYRPVTPLLIGVQSGYDFLRLERQDIAWQQVGLRTEYTPKENVLFRTLSTYDTFQQQWSNVRLDFAYRHNDQFLALGARYDGLRKSWSSANLYLENLQYGRTKFSAILSYNGFTKQFDSKQLSMIYDLHCAEAIVVYTETNTGFRPGRDISFFIRLKALPFDIPFGFGRRGQPLGTAGGVGF